jgi:hypothetical protein
LYIGLDYDLKVGFQSNLVFEGGSIDASATQDITIETAFNRTLDFLRIQTSSNLLDASFITEGPSGSYVLDFIYDIFLDAYAGVDIDLGVGTINEEIGFPKIDFSGQAGILDLKSEDLSLDVGLPAGFSLNFAWPNLSVSDTFPPDSPPVEESGASNNFLQLNLDVDDLASTLAGLPVNPFDLTASLGPIFANLQLLDVDVFAGLNFIQEFVLGLDEITGQILFEDGSSYSHTIGDELVIGNASLIDFNGNQDNKVDFKFILDQKATLGNDTDVGFNVGYNIDLLKGEIGYDISFVGVGYSDSESFGPLASVGDSADVFSVGVFDQTFGLDFEDQELIAYA